MANVTMLNRPPRAAHKACSARMRCRVIASSRKARSIAIPAACVKLISSPGPSLLTLPGSSTNWPFASVNGLLPSAVLTNPQNRLAVRAADQFGFHETLQVHAARSRPASTNETPLGTPGAGG